MKTKVILLLLLLMAVVACSEGGSPSAPAQPEPEVSGRCGTLPLRSVWRAKTNRYPYFNLETIQVDTTSRMHMYMTSQYTCNMDTLVEGDECSGTITFSNVASHRYFDCSYLAGVWFYIKTADNELFVCDAYECVVFTN